MPVLHATQGTAVDVRRRSGRLLRLIGAGFGALCALAWGLSVIRAPIPATVGLDQSWRYGLTLAAAAHMRFGEDIVFTFGPLGYVLIGSPDPTLAWSVALISAGLAAIAAVGVWSLFSRRAGLLPKMIAAFGLLTFSAFSGFDYAIFAGTLALILGAGRHPRFAPYVGAAVGLVALFGALSKYTLCVDVLGAAAAASLTDIVVGPRRRRRAALLSAGIGLGIVALGVAATFRFSPHALALYLRGAAEITRGYSVAMAISGKNTYVTEAIVVAVAICAAAVAGWRDGKRATLPIALATLFLAWKHGFVRQDGHVMQYFTTAAMLAALIGLTLRRQRSAWFGAGAAVVAITFLFIVNDQLAGPSPEIVPTQQIQDGIAFLLHPVAVTRDHLAVSRVATAADQLAPDVMARISGSTVNALPVEVAVIAQNGLRWSPLPVFQNYGAYTPYLDRINRDALIDHGADYVLWRYESIDDQLPFAEMPAATTELLCRYRVAMPEARSSGGISYALLRRTPGAGCSTTSAGSVEAHIGTPFAVPTAGHDAFVTASFHLRPTILTSIRTLLWRAPGVWLDVTLDDGTSREWRLLSDVAMDGVVISVAPRDMAEATRFLTGAPLPQVRTVTVVTQPHAYVLDGVTFTREQRREPSRS